MVVSDSWCFGVSPAHEANCSGVPKRVMSPISATNTAARIGPTPGMVWIARYPGCSRNRLVTSRAKVSTSKSSAAISRSSESTRERDSTGSGQAASSRCPPGPNRSLIGTVIPAPASTACTWHFRLERSPTSLARCRTQPRSSRVAGGAIHASGSRPIRSRSARSAASRWSFFTRRYENIFTPSGCAKCTCAPSSARASAAQYHPYVASSTTSGCSPARAITARRYSGSLEIRTVSNVSPVSVIRTSTDRRRCRSIPTNCLPSYDSLTGASSSR